MRDVRSDRREGYAEGASGSSRERLSRAGITRYGEAAMLSDPTKLAGEGATLAETSTHRSDKLYRMLLDSIPSSVLLLDPQLHIVSANQNFLQKARVQESQILGQRLDAVFPTAIYQLMNIRLRISEVFNNGIALKGERMVYRTPGLPARTYYYSLIPFRWEHKIENVMLLMEDVTDMIRLSFATGRFAAPG